MKTVCKPVPTWWTEKNYRKYLNVLIKGGIEGINRLRRSSRYPLVPEVNVPFEFEDVVVDYHDGIGFLFLYDISFKIGMVGYCVSYERTFYYDKVLDRTTLYRSSNSVKCASEIISREGFVPFSRDSLGAFKAWEWAEDILKDCEEKEKNNEDC